MDYKLQVKRAFITAYTVCLEESKKNKGKIGIRELNLIRVLVSRLNISSMSHTKVLASYIGRGFIKTENHLKGPSTIYFSLYTTRILIGTFNYSCINIFNKNKQKRLKSTTICTNPP